MPQTNTYVNGGLLTKADGIASSPLSHMITTQDLFPFTTTVNHGLIGGDTFLIRIQYKLSQLVPKIYPENITQANAEISHYKTDNIIPTATQLVIHLKFGLEHPMHTLG